MAQWFDLKKFEKNEPLTADRLNELSDMITFLRDGNASVKYTILTAAEVANIAPIVDYTINSGFGAWITTTGGAIKLTAKLLVSRNANHQFIMDIFIDNWKANGTSSIYGTPNWILGSGVFEHSIPSNYIDTVYLHGIYYAEPGRHFVSVAFGSEVLTSTTSLQIPSKMYFMLEEVGYSALEVGQ